MRLAISAFLLLSAAVAIPMLVGCDHDDYDHHHHDETVIRERPARYEEHHDWDRDHDRVIERERY